MYKSKVYIKQVLSDYKNIQKINYYDNTKFDDKCVIHIRIYISF